MKIVQPGKESVFRLCVGPTLPKNCLVSIYKHLRQLPSQSRVPNASAKKVLARKETFGRFYTDFCTKNAILMTSAKCRGTSDRGPKSKIRPVQIEAKSLRISKMYRLLGFKSILHHPFLSCSEPKSATVSAHCHAIYREYGVLA